MKWSGLFRRPILGAGAVVLLIAALAFIHYKTTVARDAIRFDLRMIGESVYEARSKNGTWPKRIEDLEGTKYLKMPYRRGALEKEQFVILFHQDLDLDPANNAEKVLAYDNTSLLSRFGSVWVCRGDLRTESIAEEELKGMVDE